MASHNATVAKIMAIHGKRLSSEDYHNMINLQSVSEIAEYLKNSTYFHDILLPVDTNTIHRGLLENILRRSVYEKYLKILNFEQLEKQEFYNFKIIRAEIDEILSCISHINAKSTEQITTTPVYLSNYVSFDLIQLSKIRSYDELLAFFKRTAYYDLLVKCRPNNEKIDYTKCEILLRTYFVKRLFATIDKYFNSKIKASLESLISTDIDLINIINSYRLKTYYNENIDVIKENILPFHGKFKKENQRELYSSIDSKDFISKFSKTYYGRQMVVNKLDINNLEQSSFGLRYLNAKRALTQSQEAPVCIYAFVFLMEIEVSNIIKIIEGIRYGVPQKDIEMLLVI